MNNYSYIGEKIVKERRKMDFKNYMCPVCENAFQEEDDVVVCPDCGTPHHRECWKKTGNCFNKEKHGTEVEKLKAPVEEKTVPEEEIQVQEAEVDFSERAKNEAKTIFEQVDSQSWENTKINGETLKDYAAVIGKNQRHYLLRFKIIEDKSGRLVWNGAAFFVPLAWAFYRKLYKLAALILALYILAIGSMSYCMFSDGEIMKANEACMQEDVYYASKVLQYASGDENIVLTPLQTELYKKIMDVEIPVFVQALNYVVIYGVRMFMGLQATVLYFKKVTQKIKTINGKNIPLDRKSFELRRRGGTAPFIFAAIIGIFEVFLFLS